MFINLGLVLVGMFVAAFVSSAVGGHAADDRHITKGMSEQVLLDEMTDQRLRWKIVRIRDHVANIYNVTFITNGLLGGILAALIVQLIR